MAASEKDTENIDESPVDVLISELIKAAESNGLKNDELLFRINQQLNKRS